MSTKDHSGRYKNNCRNKEALKNHRGINYTCAKRFNRRTLEKHFENHGKEFGCTSIESYKQHAIRFANVIDRENIKAYVDYKGTTYKYNRKNKALVIVSKYGNIISFYTTEKGFYIRFKKKGKKTWIKTKR